MIYIYVIKSEVHWGDIDQNGGPQFQKTWVWRDLKLQKIKGFKEK